MKSNAVYTLQAGQKLNDKQFLDYIEKKVRRTIRTYDLLGKKEKILAACSGGKDSTLALYLLGRITKNNRNIAIEAVYVDPSIGKHSQKSKANLTRFCKKNDIPLHIISFKKEFGKPLEGIKKLLDKKGIRWKSCTVCGILRRYLLNRKARELKATKMMTGHNLDDEVQNILMNIFQNHVELLPRLGPKPGLKNNKKMIQRIKPLYFCTEEEARLYSKIKKFDVSYDECPFRKDAYRKDIAEMLDKFEKKHRAAKTAAIQSFLKILPSLKKEGKGKAKICRSCQEPSAGSICNACKIIKLCIDGPKIKNI
ncbi:TIGR00269 family protein [Candidatus Woesearchaeota archaeon]|nr:TIGR00269 family protein [Candidatus Woesearchaeota archaeon]